MIRNLFLTIFLLSGITVFAQLKCITDSIYEEQLKNSPIFRQSEKEKLDAWGRFQDESKRKRRKRDLIGKHQDEYNIDMDKNYIIPVVVFVVHPGNNPGEAYHKTDEQIIKILEKVNKSYAGLAPYKNLKNGGAYAPVQFAFAKRTPDNKPTKGIIHLDGSKFEGYNRYGMQYGQPRALSPNMYRIQAESGWPSDFALRIFVVSKFNGSTASAFTETITGENSIFITDIAMDLGFETLAHELGHSLGLFHTFRDGCPKDFDNYDCKKQGDFVCDTEPITHPPSRGNINKCTNKPFKGTQFNIMSYSDFRDRFTPGQVARMLFSIQTNAYTKARLKSKALIPPDKENIEKIDITSPQCHPTEIKEKYNYVNLGVGAVSFGSFKIDFGGYSVDNSQVYVDMTQNPKYNKAKFISGKKYNLKLTNLGLYASKMFVFIDYNNDVFFNMKNEKIYENQKLQKTEALEITIPKDVVKNKPIRMRIVGDYTGANLLGKPNCAKHIYGQTKDFAITILDEIPEETDKKNIDAQEIKNNAEYTKIGFFTENPESAMDIVNNETGVLFPRMTTKQMWQVKNPVLGMIVYNLNEHCLALNYGKDFPRWRCLATQAITSHPNSYQKNDRVSIPENISYEGKVGINTEKPNGVLEIKNGYFGVQFPRLDNAEINNIKKPEEGLMLYNSSENCLSINIGTSAKPIWRCIRNKKLKI
ncbi:M43 family zinc metalloprotease [Ornithobacterium rhinotracheale]|uniref:M43 family zinc metalloprotease n=1 Tax=Ornithobacterium rhinotracheale TaxID=28251 RepID=UPI0040362954